MISPLGMRHHDVHIQAFEFEELHALIYQEKTGKGKTIPVVQGGAKGRIGA